MWDTNVLCYNMLIYIYTCIMMMIGAGWEASEKRKLQWENILEVWVMFLAGMFDYQRVSCFRTHISLEFMIEIYLC